MKLDVDDFIRACLAIWVASRIDSCGVIETMADVTITKGVPEHIISDNDSEMTAKVVRNLFCKARSEDAVHRAWQSVGERILRESFNGKLRDECQTAESLKEAIVVIEQLALLRQKSSIWIGGRRCKSILPVENIRQRIWEPLKSFDGAFRAIIQTK